MLDENVWWAPLCCAAVGEKRTAQSHLPQPVAALILLVHSYWTHCTDAALDDVSLLCERMSLEQWGSSAAVVGYPNLKRPPHLVQWRMQRIGRH